MTHSGGKPHNVGDRGQRYEVVSNGYPNRDGEGVVGWSNDIEGAYRLMDAILTAPGCTSARIYDREEKRGVIKRYAGVLR